MRVDVWQAESRRLSYQPDSPTPRKKSQIGIHQVDSNQINPKATTAKTEHWHLKEEKSFLYTTQRVTEFTTLHDQPSFHPLVGASGAEV